MIIEKEVRVLVISLDRYRRTRSVGLAIPFGERVANARKDQGLTQDQLRHKKAEAGLKEKCP